MTETKFRQLIKECTKIYNKDSKSYKDATAAKVIREYFRIVGKTIMTGQEYNFPKKFGKMYVRKRKAKHTDNITSFSPAIGYDYDIVLESPYLERFDFEFKASETIRNNLYQLIRKGKEFPYYGN